MAGDGDDDDGYGRGHDCALWRRPTAAYSSPAPGLLVGVGPTMMSHLTAEAGLEPGSGSSRQAEVSNGAQPAALGPRQATGPLQSAARSKYLYIIIGVFCWSRAHVRQMYARTPPGLFIYRMA